MDDRESRLGQLTARIAEIKATLAGLTDPQGRRLLLKEMRDCLLHADAIIRDEIQRADQKDV